MTEKKPKMTAKMAEAVRMRAEGMTFAQIAKERDLHITSVRSLLNGVVLKLAEIGITSSKQDCHLHAHNLEAPDLDSSLSKKLLDESDLPSRHKMLLAKRVASMNFPDAARLDEEPFEHLSRILGEKSIQLAGYIDHFAMSAAPLKDLSASLEKVIHVKQLLDGQPTHIVGDERRQRVDVLVRRVVDEARRRGITLDGRFERVDDEEVA